MRRPETTDDEELVRRFLIGRSAAAFEAIYDRHSPYLFRVASMMLRGDPEAAEDALQETWLRAVTSLSRFRGESALRTWLCGITINCCREVWRRRSFAPMDDFKEAAAESTGEGARLDALRLEKALLQLDAPSREVIELHDVLGHTHEEVAAILGIAPGTSKSRLFRARETLRALLGTDFRAERKRSAT